MTKDDLKAALDIVNVRAFLKGIRLGEGTSDDMGYYRIVGGQMFSDDSTHPHVRVYLPRWKLYSTAAGAYQIIFPTWQGLCNQYGFTDFSPETQDMMAVALIAGRHALNDVISGLFAEAVDKCNEEWASLPGSKSGQRTEDFENVKQVYLDNGGELA